MLHFDAVVEFDTGAQQWKGTLTQTEPASQDFTGASRGDVLDQLEDAADSVTGEGGSFSMTITASGKPSE